MPEMRHTVGSTYPNESAMGDQADGCHSVLHSARSASPGVWCMWHMCVQHAHAGTLGGQRKASNLLKPEALGIGNHPAWVLGTKSLEGQQALWPQESAAAALTE